MTKNKCLNPECDRESNTRGLCLKCYGVARHLVATKKTTWQDMEQRGVCTKPNLTKSGRPTTSNWLLTATTIDNHIDELELQETGKVTKQ